MFQLGSLVVLYGLLIGTSESLLDSGLLNNLNVQSAVSGDALQDLDVNVQSLQQATDWLTAKDNIVKALNTVDVAKLNLSPSQGGLGLKINKLEILNLQADLSSDLKGINLKVPVVVEAAVNLPLLGPAVDVKVSLDLITSLDVQFNAQTGLPTLTIGKCSSDKDKISISLLNRRSTLVNRILDGVSDLLSNIVTGLLQHQICPLLRFLLTNLNVTLTQDLLSNLLTGQLPVAL